MTGPSTRSPTRPAAAILLVVLVALAGCTGFLGESDSPPDATETNAGTTDATGIDATDGEDGADAGTETPGTEDPGTDAPVRTLAGDHPYVDGDSLDASSLVADHLAALRRADSFTLSNNGSARWAANDTLAVRYVDRRLFDLASQRYSIVRRAIEPGGTVASMSGRYANASAVCTSFADDVQCGDGGFDGQQALGLTVETTGLETIAGPAFSPDGTVERDGQSLYRYSATELRSSLDESTASELGSNASLDRTTLLVAPDGRIVEYHFVLERDGGDGARVLLERTYSTRAVNATSVAPPPWLRS